MRLRAGSRLAFVASSRQRRPCARAYRRSSARGTSSSGRTSRRAASTGAIPASPATPVPRSARKSTVSAWSSAWCAVAIHSASAASRAWERNAYLASRASDSDRGARSARAAIRGTPHARHSPATHAASAPLSFRIA